MTRILKILIILVFTFLSRGGLLFAQTPGINYQALILNSEEIQIPGSNVQENEILLTFEDVSFRFSILNESYEEYYVEEQHTTSDENGMISLIVGEGTPLFSTFDSIVWDGTLKYLNVEIDIHSQNQGYVFLDIQKILYLPQSGMVGTIELGNTLQDLPKDDNNVGDIMWIEAADDLGNPSLMVWDGMEWQYANEDFNPTNELGLVVVPNANDRDLMFSPPNAGDQVWNQECGCVQIHDGNNWLSIKPLDVLASNGTHLDNTNTTIKLGGKLVEPTKIGTDATNTLSMTGLQETIPTTDNRVLMTDSNTGVITRTTLENLFQEEVTLTIAAVDGQSQFATPLPIISPSKVNIYRNGVRIGFSVVNNTIVELEPEAICYEGDEIRIVQFTN